MLTRTLALELATHASNVNGLAGHGAHPVNQAAIDDPDLLKSQVQASRRSASRAAEWVAKVAVFLASSDASYRHGGVVCHRRRSDGQPRAGRMITKTETTDRTPT